MEAVLTEARQRGYAGERGHPGSDGGTLWRGVGCGWLGNGGQLLPVGAERRTAASGGRKEAVSLFQMWSQREQREPELDVRSWQVKDPVPVVAGGLGGPLRKAGMTLRRPAASRRRAWRS